MKKTQTIAKNTIFLYIRSIVSLIIQLITSRLVLKGLGVEEFGVYQVIGGLVTMFAFFNTSLSSSTQRFITYAIGKNDINQIRKVFSMSINLHLILSIIIFLLIEFFGYWFLSNKINIGNNVSYNTAYFILHCTALSLVVTINSVPYNSLLISKEEMKYFAYIDILGAFLKMILAFSLSIVTGKHLIYYASMMLLITIFIRFLYSYICKRKFTESKYIFLWDNQLFKDMSGFITWTSLSALSYMFRTQGIGLILNVFWGPVLNAAQGIASQVNGAVKTFTQNFQISFNPQITKSYAQNNFGYMNLLVFSGAKLSLILILLISVPVILEINFLLNIWLIKVPPHTSILVVLVLIESIVLTYSCTSNTAIRATGKIRTFELTYNIFILLAFPAIYIVLKYYQLYYIPLLILIIFEFLSVFIKFYYLKKVLPDFNISIYFRKVILRISALALLASMPLCAIKFYWDDSFLRLIFSTVVFCILFSFLVFKWGLNYKEKELVVYYIKKIKAICI